jgi:hypothetical protein
MPKLMHRLLFAGAALSLFCATPLLAADKAEVGGSCCSDLEERIAELEAVTAKKGNKKVKLTVTGQISKAIVYTSLDGEGHAQVGENSNEAAESYIEFRAEARITGNWRAGAVIQVGIGSFDEGAIGYGNVYGDTNGLYTRKAYVFIGNEKAFGTASLGKASQATDGVTAAGIGGENPMVNTGVASTPLSLRPLVGAQIGTVADIFDGNITDVIRYDSPSFEGFKVAASWANAVDAASGPGDQAQVWDVAVSYFKDFGVVQVAAAAGYRDGMVIPTFANITDVKVYSGSALVKHMTSGVFLGGAYGSFDASGLLPGVDKITGWQGQGGVEQRWNPLGKTTIYAEYGQLDLGNLAGDASPTFMGLGVVQNIENVAMDLYLSGRRYELDDLGAGELDVIMAGGRVRF